MPRRLSRNKQAVLRALLADLRAGRLVKRPRNADQPRIEGTLKLRLA